MGSGDKRDLLDDVLVPLDTDHEVAQHDRHLDA
jgi:hypothetical protein